MRFVVKVIQYQRSTQRVCYKTKYRIWEYIQDNGEVKSSEDFFEDKKRYSLEIPMYTRGTQ